MQDNDQMLEDKSKFGRDRSTPRKKTAPTVSLNMNLGTANPKLPWLVALSRDSLNQLEQEYLRVGAESCGFFRQKTQLSGFLLCGIRSLSLLRGMLRLFEPQYLDSSAALHRSFLESWFLQVDFRIRRRTSRNVKVEDWFQKGSKLWKTRHTRDVVKQTLVALGAKGFPFELEYQAVSNATHPTSEAAYSSQLVVAVTGGMSPSGQERLRNALHKISDHFINLLSAALWLSLFDDPMFLETGFRKNRLPSAYKLYEQLVVNRATIDWGNLC